MPVNVIDPGIPLSGNASVPLWTAECALSQANIINVSAPAALTVTLAGRATNGAAPFDAVIAAPHLIDYFTITGTWRGKLQDKLGVKVKHPRWGELELLTGRILAAGAAAGVADQTVTLDMDTKPPDGAVLMHYVDGEVFTLPMTMAKPAGTFLRDYTTLETQVLSSGQEPPAGFVLSGYGTETEIPLPRQVPAPPGAFFKRQEITDTKTQALGSPVPDGYDVDSMVDSAGTITRPWTEQSPQGFRMTGTTPNLSGGQGSIVLGENDNINEMISPGDSAVFVRYLNIHGSAPDQVVGQFGETVPGVAKYAQDGSYSLDLAFPLTPWGVQMLDSGASGNAYYASSAGGTGVGVIPPQGIKFFAQYTGGHSVRTDFDATSNTAVAGATVSSFDTKIADMPSASEVRVYIGTVYSTDSIGAGPGVYVVKGTTRNFYRYYTMGTFRWTIFPPRVREFLVTRAPLKVFTPSSQVIVRRTNVYARIDAVFSHIVANWVRRSGVYAVRSPDIPLQNLLEERTEALALTSSQWLGKEAEGVWTVEVTQEPSPAPVLAIPGLALPETRVENLALNVHFKGNAAYLTSNLTPTVSGGVTSAVVSANLRADLADLAMFGILCGISGSRTMGILCWYAVQRKSLEEAKFDVACGIGTTCHVQNVNLLTPRESQTYRDLSWEGMSTGGNQGQQWLIRGTDSGHVRFPVTGNAAAQVDIQGNRLTFRLLGGYEKLVFQDPSVALINTFTSVKRSA